MKKLQVGTGKFRGKLPFKCFTYGRVGEYASKCPYKENHEKGKNYENINIRGRFENKKSFYTHKDSDGVSNREEGESDQEYKLLWNLKINVLISLMMFLWIP